MESIDALDRAVATLKKQARAAQGCARGLDGQVLDGRASGKLTCFFIDTD